MSRQWMLVACRNEFIPKLLEFGIGWVIKIHAVRIAQCGMICAAPLGQYFSPIGLYRTFAVSGACINE
jgi:hypothetical protein